MCSMDKFKQMTKDLSTDDLVLHAKRILHSSFAVAYQSSCDYPMVLGAGILLLLLHRICPPLLAFLVSSSPLLLLTGLLLGALLSYGEPSTPSVTGEGASDDQQTLSPKSKNSIADCSTEEVERVTIETLLDKRTGSAGVYVVERAPADNTHDNHCEGTDVMFVAADTVISTESAKYAQTNVIVGREGYGEQISEKSDLLEFESSNNERGDYEVHNHYQLGEPISPCWQSADRQDLCYGSESDLTDDSSSPDASMTDIIPMLEELHPLIDLGTGHPTLASRSRDNLNSSSDDDESDLDEDDDSDEEGEGEEEEKDDGNSQEDVIGQNGRADGLMELQRAKNILKFELDQRLMDLQTADATQKLKDASRFFVQVPSISTPRGEPYDPSNASGEGEVIELPPIPDSAPSLLLPRGNLFDLPSDHIVDHDSQLQETWTPRSYSPATQLRKHGNFHGRHSVNPHRSGLKSEKGEISGEDALGYHSDSDAAKQGNDGRLSCSQEAHLGEEIKILSPAISDAGVLKGDCGMHGGNNYTDSSDGINSFPIMKNESSTLEAEISVHPGGEQSVLCCLSKVNNSEQHVIEANSIDEVNSLFRSRMEEVLVQSVSEPVMGQPLTVTLEDDSSDPALCPNPGMHATEASSVEELNSQFIQVNQEALTCDACDVEPVQEKSSEEVFPAADEHISEVPIRNGSRELSTAEENQQLAGASRLHVVEVSSAEEMKMLFNQLEDVQDQMHHSLKHKLAKDTGGGASDMLCLETEPVEDVDSAFEQLSSGHIKGKISQDVEVELKPSELNSELEVMEAQTLDDDSGYETFGNGSEVLELKDSAGTPKSIAVEGRHEHDV
ncbi:uncharacterized protein LOC123398347 [Hordeum vulgare subsp. vulgare]|uniref:Uncharacterized protein n=1 Tax=Hordeum vulgare subsp. vulgare TaxID=112509 RepID=M0V8E9_HORVV|nr:uncharacterized protein LOC123398347 [Hordeum vulgare subsp. vulgare]